MYNRYIPQNDGTYRRSRIQDQPSPPPQRHAPSAEVPRQVVPEESCPCQSQTPPCQSGRGCPIPPRPKGPPVSIASFLKQLIPGGFDSEDLIIVLLLLLMAGDCRDDPNSALLTLALYLFL